MAKKAAAKKDLPSDEVAEAEQNKKKAKETKAKKPAAKKPSKEADPKEQPKDSLAQKLFSDASDLSEVENSAPSAGADDEVQQPKKGRKKNAPATSTSSASETGKGTAVPEEADPKKKIKVTKKDSGEGKSKKKQAEKATSNKEQFQANGGDEFELNLPKKQSTFIMVCDALKHLDERKGTSVIALKKYILDQHPELDQERFKVYFRKAVLKALDDGVAERPKGSENSHGMTGRIKLVKTSKKPSKKSPREDEDEENVQEKENPKKTKSLNLKKKPALKNPKKTVPKNKQEA